MTNTSILQKQDVDIDKHNLNYDKLIKQSRKTLYSFVESDEMEEKKMSFDYGSEVEKLDKETTWKPDVGCYTIIVLSEPERTDFVEKRDDGTEKKTPQIKLEIEVDGEQKNWFVGEGKTSQSAYGQLMVIGKEHKGLMGQALEVVITKGKNNNRYTFPEASKILQKQAKECKDTKDKKQQHESGEGEEVKEEKVE